jgi:hypothetical protein
VKRLLWLLLAGLAGCSHPAPPVAVAPSPALCRIGPDGARPVADRGIGGTGAVVQSADRGIGGTGIIGVITGFASVCVAGEEVALPPGVTARMDEDPARLSDLRAGQVVAIEAAGQDGDLQARRIVVRHAVIGPIEATGPGTMTVAGQLVGLTGATGSAVAAKPGLWVAVSGLRMGNGMIAATRVDPAPPGRLLVRGELVRIYGATRIGSLPVQLPPDVNLPAGWPVTVTGFMQGGVLVADSATLDVASQSPSAYFGPSVSNFIVESFVSVLAGGYLVDRDFVSGRGFGVAGTQDRGIARYTRAPGGLVATGLQPGGVPAGRPGTFAPAPSFPGASARGASGGPGFGGSGLGSPGLGSPGLGSPGFGSPGLGGPGLGGLGLGLPGIGAPGGGFSPFGGGVAGPGGAGPSLAVPGRR